MASSKRGLRFWRGAVDFVGQQYVGENRPTLEFELLLDGGINRNSQHVRRQHVAGELHPLKAAIERPREGLGQSGFADAGNAFDQQMSARQQGNQGQADDFILAANDLAQSFFQLGRASGGGGRGFRGH